MKINRWPATVKPEHLLTIKDRGESNRISLIQMKQVLILKKKSKQKSAQKLKPAQKVALHAIQKQVQLLKLKQWLVVIGFISGAALLRIPMQVVPSVEPITFFAILAGWLFGKRKGFITGAAAGYMSGFFMIGGQGPWSIFQVLGWGIAGFLGGFIKDIKPSKNYLAFWLKSIIPLLIIAIISTLIFEIIVNIGSIAFFPSSIFVLFLSALPFLLVHLISNSLFSLLLPFARKTIYEKGKFNEVDICNSIINRINSKFKHSRPLPTRKTAEQ